MGRGVSKSSCQKSRHLDGDWLVVFEWQSPKNDNVASGPDGVPVARDSDKSESFMHLDAFSLNLRAWQCWERGRWREKLPKRTNDARRGAGVVRKLTALKAIQSGRRVSMSTARILT